MLRSARLAVLALTVLISSACGFSGTSRGEDPRYELVVQFSGPPSDDSIEAITATLESYNPGVNFDLQEGSSPLVGSVLLETDSDRFRAADAFCQGTKERLEAQPLVDEVRCSMIVEG